MTDEVEVWLDADFLSCGKLTRNAPITAAIAPLAPRHGTVEPGPTAICASIDTIPPSR